MFRKLCMGILASCLILLSLCGCGSKPADSALPDGTYSFPVTLTGGSGRASVQSPADITVKNGAMTATVIWSSANYDFMMVDGKRYDAVSREEHSVFEIPVAALDTELAVQADTTAMSEAHLIDYTLTFHSDAASADASEDEDIILAHETVPLSDQSRTALEALTPAGSMELSHAEQFTVDFYEGGYALISVSGSDYLLFVPKGMGIPEGLGDDVTILNGPLQKIYLAASSAMDLFREIDALDAVTMTSTTAENWSLPEVQIALSSGKIRYIGKYNAPDYEAILADGTELAVESTMVYHCPEVREQLISLGIPVMVEHSSYEKDPLGRMEWIKLYGLLTGHLPEAEAFFEQSVDRIGAIEAETSDPKSVVFFYISSSGYVNVRKPGDYISKMIEMAGGTYALSSLEAADDSSSTMNMQMETFFAEAKDADVLIYNSTTEGNIEDMKQLLGKSELLAGFKAVQEGNVWCTGQNMFQQTTGAADMVSDIHEILSGTTEDTLTFLHRIK